MWITIEISIRNEADDEFTGILDWIAQTLKQKIEGNHYLTSKIAGEL